MALYVYEGQAPECFWLGDSPQVARPGDVREFAQAPSWGQWRLVEAPETPAAPAAPAPAPETPAPSVPPPPPAPGTEG